MLSIATRVVFSIGWARRWLHPSQLAVDELLKSCEEVNVKRSGPGGQHRNKVSTGVVLKHVPSGLTAEAAERRSQMDNRTMAIKRLRLRIALQHRTDSQPWKPSDLFVGRFDFA